MPLQGLQPLLSSASAYSWAPAVHRKSIGLTGWPTVSPPLLRTWELSRPLYSFSLIQCWPPISLQGQYSCSSLPTSEMRGTSRSSWPDAATPLSNIHPTQHPSPKPQHPSALTHKSSILQKKFLQPPSPASVLRFTDVTIRLALWRCADRPSS